MNAIRGSNDAGNDVQAEAIKTLATALESGNQLPIQQAAECCPRVQKPRVNQSKHNSPSRLQGCRPHQFQGCILDQETGQLLEYRQLLRHPKYLDIWNRAGANEFGRLAQGIGGRIKGTNTIQFIQKHAIPIARLKDVTYIKFVSSILFYENSCARTHIRYYFCKNTPLQGCIRKDEVVSHSQ
eukprot:CCRYP_008343-RA/>CCRYP_008343-RA protein AED:0.62 eAED:0.41 QI:0/0/0/1/0/0/2/0/182